MQIGARLEERVLRHVLGIAAGSKSPRHRYQITEQCRVLRIELLGVDHRPQRNSFHTTLVRPGGRRLYTAARFGEISLFGERPLPYPWRMLKIDRETDRIRRIYDRRANKADGPSGDANLRWLCEQAEGETLEIGIGKGRTLPFYPPGIRLTGIELSSVGLDVAERRARELGIHATLRQGDATALPYPDDHFDSVVFAYVLCTVPNDRQAVAEAVRVLRPGGRLLLVEHVRSPNIVVRALERLLDPIEVRRMGDHLMRDPLDHVLAEGMEVETLERRMLGVIERLAARKPDADELEEAV